MTSFYCPLCGDLLPPEDTEVCSPPTVPIVAQVQCRPCRRVFTLCEEKKFLRLVWDGKPLHPEDRT